MVNIKIFEYWILVNWKNKMNERENLKEKVAWILFKKKKQMQWVATSEQIKWCQSQYHSQELCHTSLILVLKETGQADPCEFLATGQYSEFQGSLGEALSQHTNKQNKTVIYL